MLEVAPERRAEASSRAPSPRRRLTPRGDRPNEDTPQCAHVVAGHHRRGGARLADLHAGQAQQAGPRPRPPGRHLAGAGAVEEGRHSACSTQSIAIIRNRVDALGVGEPEISRQGNNIIVELPGVKDQDKARERRRSDRRAAVPPGARRPASRPRTTCRQADHDYHREGRDHHDRGPGAPTTTHHGEAAG